MKKKQTTWTLESNGLAVRFDAEGAARQLADVAGCEPSEVLDVRLVRMEDRVGYGTKIVAIGLVPDAGGDDDPDDDGDDE